MEILFLEKIYHEKIWGGNKLQAYFNDNIKGKNIGECWTVSAHPHGDCKIINGVYKDQALSWLWKNKREIFGDMKGNKFPLLTKMIDASDDLSVQVHPDDNYAFEHENGEFGKTECWYIIDCDEGAELIIGHYARDKKEMEELIQKGDWNKLLRKVSIKPGDFFYIPAGTIHAIGKGTLLLEIQQASDITYRVYDYHRLQNGMPRELHVDKSIDVTTIPHKDYQIIRNIQKLENGNGFEECLIKEKYFTVLRLNINGGVTYGHGEQFKIVHVLNGVGSIDGINIKKGDHFIIPHRYNPLTLTGHLELIISYI